MPPQERGLLRIKKPVERTYFSRQENDNEFTNEDGLRIAKAQLKRYENDPEWNSSENRNNAINFLKYQRIPLLLKRIESRKPMCKKITNTVTGTVRSVCGIQRHRTRKARTRKDRTHRKKTRRVR